MSDLIRPHEATGDLVITAVHVPIGSGLADIASARWRDSASGGTGQSSRVALAHLIEQDGGHVFVDWDGASVPVDTLEEDGHLIMSTRGYPRTSDPLLRLPRY
jgi:hypothetical protein